VVRAGSLLLPTPRTASRAVELLHRFGASRVIFGAAAPLGLLAPALRGAGAQRILGLTHGHEAWWSAVPGARRLLRRIGDGCDHLTTISGYTERRIARALSASGRERMLRLPPPVDVNQFRPGAVDHDRSRCVAVGRFVAQKGFSCLLNTWRLILDGRRDADPPLELILIGDGPQRTRLESMVDRLGLRSTVTLTGAIPRAVVISELQQATVFALPVRTRLAGLNPEGLGLAALEAAACGLPVIIGEYGPANMSDADIMALWQTAQQHGIPYIGWVFHMRCPPNMLQDTASDGCGLDAATGYDFPRTAWGDMLKAHLATPW